MAKIPEIEVSVPGVPGAPIGKLKVIGVLSQDAPAVHRIVCQPEGCGTMLPAALQLPIGTYFFRINQGEDVQQLRRALGTAY